MLKWLGGLIDSNEKQIQRLKPLVNEINELEPEFEKLSAEELKAKTQEFKNYLIEATSDEIEALKQVEQELEEAKSKLITTDEIIREDTNTEIKHIEDKKSRLENDLIKAENDALNDILPEAFAAVREAARRTIGQRHFDVQLIGGIVLHQGKIAEMKTGEGKTLAATLPLYLNSLSGQGCHLVTVNDYLSKRGAVWMGPVYQALGVTVAAIHSQTPDNLAPSFVYDPTYEATDRRWNYLRPVNRKEAYLADITYGTNNEFGFDYLRDNMVMDLSNCVQRSVNYAIVDEVDNLLIDEARTPLIISGPAPRDEGRMYSDIDAVVSRMKTIVQPHEPVTPEEKEEEARLEELYDYISYEKTHNVKETPRGQETLARAFGLKVDDLFPDETQSRSLPIEEVQRRDKILSAFLQSMRAHAWYHRDREYIVKDNEVIIVDEFTGRLMHGRRYSEGLHQAIEAKERVQVKRESLTYATITFQNYFRMYRKLAGMTGTAQTEAEEFSRIYGLEVVQIPTNRPMIRKDFPDRIYKDEKIKFNAIVNEVVETNAQKRPLLIGTTSIEKSEYLSDLLKRKGVTCRVLNAKPENSQKEAEIVAQAGRLGAVTVATNMAGRGVDIVLGGEEPPRPAVDDPAAQKEWEKQYREWQKQHEGVTRLGGLHIIGTERHEARRIDNQLRGRAGRQGDPGSSRFYVSIEDDIMKRFGGDRIRGLMQIAGMDENTPIENRLVNRAIESAQVRVEGFHFDVRKHLVEFDDVVNKHRELIYTERRKILSGTDLKANILSMVKEEIHSIISSYSSNRSPDGWDVSGALAEIISIMPLPAEIHPKNMDNIRPEELEKQLVSIAESIYEQREKEYTPQNMRVLERLVMLRIVDSLWVEHLTLMDEKRREAGWATLQQVKAVDAYKNLGAQQWEILSNNIRHDIAHTIFHVAVRQDAPRQASQQTVTSSPMAQVVSGHGNNKPVHSQAGNARKVGRNDPCPCGSGKKYKHCHGK
jgi:preprotein translocase subunit SecA